MHSWTDIFADLRVHPGRTFLTAISLFLGVVAVMAIIVTGDVVREVFVAQAEQQTGRFQTFARHILLSATQTNQEVLAAISDLPRGTESKTGCRVIPSQTIHVATTRISSAESQHGIAQEIETVLVCGDYRSIYRLPLSQGQWLSDDSFISPYEVVANKAAAQTYGGVGTTIWLTSDTTATAFPALVVGVVNDGSQQSVVYSSAAPWLANAPQLFSIASIILLWQETPVTIEEVRSATSDWLFDHQFSRDSEVMEVDSVAQFQQFIALLQWSFSGVAILSLIVAALGIVNVGLASVRERAHELVIRRALGASKWSIARMIMGSSLLLAVMVAVVSALAVWVGVLVFRGALTYDSPVQPPEYPIAAAVLGTSVSILTALIGSLVPGIVASRLQPGLALRD